MTITKHQQYAPLRERAPDGKFKTRTASTEALRRDYEGGVALDDIYARHRTSRKTLMREAKAGNWTRPSVYARRKEEPLPAWYAEAARLRAEGVPRNEVARRFGVTPPAVTYAVRRASPVRVDPPAWVPKTLREPYARLASTRGEIAAAKWARAVKAELRP